MEQFKLIKKDSKIFHLQINYEFSEMNLEEILLLSNSFSALSRYASKEGYSPIVSMTLFSLSEGFRKSGLNFKKVQ